MKFETLPYTVATNSEKQELEATMRRGNRILKKWHERVKQVRTGKYARIAFRNDLFKLLGNLDVAKPVTIEGITIPKAEIRAILDVREIEARVLMAFSRMVSKESHRWSERKAGLDFDDLYNEGISALISSVYYYTEENVRFSTFACATIRRRLYRQCLSVPEYAAKLRNDFERAKAELNRPATFDEIVLKMGLSANQRKVLERTLTNIFAFSSLDDAVMLDGPSNDYTHLGGKYHGTNGQVGWSITGQHNSAGPTLRQHPTLEFDMMEAIRNVSLSDLERVALDAWIENGCEEIQAGTGVRKRSNKGLSEAAKKVINPVTGKPYTRAALSQALQRAKLKIKQAYPEAA